MEIENAVFELRSIFPQDDGLPNICNIDAELAITVLFC